MTIERIVNYIFNYIKYVFFSIEEFKDNKYVLDIARRIHNNMPNSDFCTGNLDFYINNFIAQELKLMNSTSYIKFQDIKNHIYLIINYYKVYYHENVENYDHIICEIMRNICEKYSYDDIMAGKCDEEIEGLIKSNIEYGFNPDIKREAPINIMYLSSNGESVVDDKEYIYNYVYRIIETNKNLFRFDGEISFLVDMICEEMYRNGIKTDDILSHMCDDLILSYIRQKKFGIEFREEFKNIYNEVREYVENNNTYMELDNFDEKVSEEIFNLSSYLLERGFSKEDIQLGKCNQMMERHLRFNCIMTNSKKCNVKGKGKQNPNRFLLSLNKGLYSIKTKAIVLAIISLMGSALIGKNMANTGEATYEQIDEYDYPDIPYQMSEEFAATLNHIMSQFIINADIKAEYGQICLFKAFESMEYRPYNGMDTLLFMIKQSAKTDENVFPLYEEIKDCESYIDYMYRRLIEHDPDKITSSIGSAVKTYNSQVANYKELNPYELLDRGEKREIEKLVGMYGRYISDLESEFERENGKVR